MSVYDLAMSRRSVRRFSGMPVPEHLLRQCVDAARVAPSARNLQPLEYIAVDDEKLLPGVFSTLQWAGYIRPEGDPPEGKHPRAYIVILRNSDVSGGLVAYDIGLAVQSIVLVALEDGVASCILASVDRDKLRTMLHIPPRYEISLVVALGYPDERPLVEPYSGSVKYWKDERGVLHVPKRNLEDVIHWNSF